MTSFNLLQNKVTRFREMSSELLEYAKANRDEGIFNDVTLQVDNLSIGANRMVLACYSTFFEKMFKTEMRERYQPNIPVTGVDGETANALVGFMYNGQITIDSNSVMNLLAGADYFQIDDVKAFCFDYLMDRITSDNWYAVETAAKLYRSDQLQKYVNQFIADNFENIIKSNEFKAFLKDDLTSFVRNLNRNQVNESSIYKAIVNWIKYNEEERKKEFPDLFQLIELDILPSNCLLNISLENLVQENAACAKSVFLLFSKLIKEKEIKENESKILMIGGEESREKVTEIFSSNSTEPKSYPNLPYGVEDHCVLKWNDVIYCIGGCCSKDDRNIYDKVYQMVLRKTTLRWSEITSMNEKRRKMGAAVFRNCLVVAGGVNGTVRLASAEYFDDSLNKWQMAPTMQQRRFGNALVECDNNLYALAGWDGNDHLLSVERLQSLNGKWEFVAPMLTQRSALAAVSINGSIYAIGGRSHNKDANSRHKTVERYDPKSDRWSYVCDMNYVRSRPCACVLHGRIFVAGGRGVEGKVVKNIECYDPIENEWKVVELLRNKNFALNSATVVI